VNTTDPDCTRVNSRQGSHAGYNAQVVVDDQNGLIVHGDVVNDNNDLGQLTQQIQQANTVFEKPCETVCADAGYSDSEDLAQLDRCAVDVIVPSQRQVHKREPGPFDKSRFRYNANEDCYVCPVGHRLRYHRYEEPRRRKIYLGGPGCRRCAHFGVCTTNRFHGRKVTRIDHETVREKLEQRYRQPEARAIYQRRKTKVEHPFGHIKRNLEAGYFLRRGLAGVRAEWSLLACGFNLTRLIRMLGVEPLVAKLTG